MRWMWVLPLVGLAMGCEKAREETPRSGPAPASAINPAMVVSDRELLHEHKAISFVFPYDQADGQGWPADPAEQRVVRIIQDNGIVVAFAEMPPGKRQVAIGIKDSDKILAVRAAIAKVSAELTPKLRRSFGLDRLPTTSP